jgi:hypothetical protein
MEHSDNNRSDAALLDKYTLSANFFDNNIHLFQSPMFQKGSVSDIKYEKTIGAATSIQELAGATCWYDPRLFLKCIANYMSN